MAARRVALRASPGTPEDVASPPATSSEETDRIRGATGGAIDRRIDAEALERVRAAAAGAHDGLSRRIRELDGESDIERWLMINASILALVMTGLGAFVHPLFLIGTAIVLSFLLQHGIQGWCPPLPLFRRMGVRSRREIAAERAAAKALRGDFDVLGERGSDAADRAMTAASRG
jgi:hypothetical protein